MRQYESKVVLLDPSHACMDVYCPTGSPSICSLSLAESTNASVDLSLGPVVRSHQGHTMHQAAQRIVSAVRLTDYCLHLTDAYAEGNGQIVKEGPPLRRQRMAES
jgi:hypothetical protein